MSLLSLNCLIDGEDREKIITVEVEKTKNVAILKKLIKEEKTRRLTQVDAADLELWMTNNLHVDELGTEPVHVNFDTCIKLSPPTLKLSSFFNDVMVDDHLHIIGIAPGECNCFKLSSLSHSRTSSITTHIHFCFIQIRYLRTHQRRNTAHTHIFTLLTHYLSTTLLSRIRR